MGASRLEHHVKENVFFGLFLVALIVAIAILITGHMRPRSAMRDLEMTGIIKRFPKLATVILKREMNIAWAKALRMDEEDQPDTIGMQEAGVIRRNVME